MVAPARRYHMDLTDPLPAGLEPVNGELATSEEPVPPPSRRGRGRRIFRSYRTSGTTIKISATSGPKPSPRWSGEASTTIPT